MNIYSCVDFKNIDKIIILFYSVYLNADKSKREQLKFYILVDDKPILNHKIPSEISSRLFIKKINFDKKWIKLLNEFNDNFYKLSNWCKNNMNFARFLIFKAFPDIDRVIYLDWDMIVIGDIFELKKTYDDNEYIVGAELNKNQTIFNNSFVQNFKYSNTVNSLNQKDKLKNHMVSKVMKYLSVNNNQMFNSMGFNAGFYIISKHHFDEIYLTELIRKLITIQSKLSCFNFGTQVVMNFIHIDKKKFVPKVWNHLPDLDEKSDDVKIIHWNGLNKPWDNKNETINKLWWEYSKKIKLTNTTR